MRVLVVEDNPELLEMLSEILTSWGHEVETSADGIEATEKVRSFLPELALVDLTLPTIDGYELAQQLSARAETRKTRLIAMSGYDQPDALAKSKAAGFERHLVKPIDLKTLESLLRPEA